MLYILLNTRYLLQGLNTGYIPRRCYVKREYKHDKMIPDMVNSYM